MHPTSSWSLLRALEKAAGVPNANSSICRDIAAPPPYHRFQHGTARFTMKHGVAALAVMFRLETMFPNETPARLESSRLTPDTMRHAICLRTLARRRMSMPVPLLLTFVSTVAFAIQLLIFAYLYSSHRVRFFQYLLLAWGAYTLSKGLKLVDVLVFDLEQSSVPTGVATVAAVGFMLAAGLAYRWNYRLRARDVLIGSGLALVLALGSELGSGDEMHVIGVGLGAIQMVAGALFWPARSRAAAGRVRGERLL